jgi:hypothetical protein
MFSPEAISQLLEQEEQIKGFELAMLHRAEVEKGLAAPTQAQVNELYEEIYNFMIEAMHEAKIQDKFCIFVIGEIHATNSGKGSLVIQKIFMQIAKQLGIKNVFLEGTANMLSLTRMLMVPMLKDMRAKLSDQEYIKFANEQPIRFYLIEQKLLNSFTIIPSEQNENSLAESSIEQIDQEMCNTIMANKNHGLFMVGLAHLNGISNCKLLEEIFLVYPVNTIEPEFIRAALGEDEYLNFAINSKKVKQFYLKARLLEANPDKLLAMVDKAHQQFLSRKTNELSHQTNSQQHAQVSRGSTAELPLTQTQLLQDKISMKALADSQQTTCTCKTLISAPPYPLETVPMHALIQAGFWAASKLGLCENPSYSAASIAFSNPFSEQIYREQQQETAAKLQLSKEGSSLEAAFHYFFGKKFNRGTEAEQQKQKKFLIKVINGEFDNETRIKFAALAQTQNDHQRNKEISKLMQRTEATHTQYSEHSKRNFRL